MVALTIWPLGHTVSQGQVFCGMGAAIDRDPKLNAGYWNGSQYPAFLMCEHKPESAHGQRFAGQVPRMLPHPQAASQTNRPAQF